MSGSTRVRTTSAPGPVARAAARTIAARRGREGLTRDPAERVTLPHRAKLEERFGRPLSGIDVFAGPRSAQALRRLGAQSATQGRTIFLAEPDAPIGVVAHEVAHALQSSGPSAATGVPATVEPDGSRPEREADRAAMWTANRDGPIEISEGLKPGTIALLRRSAPEPSDPPPTLTLGANPVVPAVGRREQPRPAPEHPSTEQVSGERGGTRSRAAEPVPDAPSRREQSGEESPATLEATAAPAAADGAQNAEREAGAAAADGEIAAATTPADRLRAYAKAPPSVKATQAAALAGDVAGLAAEESKAVTADVPAVQVRLDGAPTLTRDAAAPTGAPSGQPQGELQRDAAAPAAAPEVAVPDVPGSFRPDTDAAAPLALVGNASPEVLAAGIDDSLAAVPTSDRDVPRSAGPRPAIPLEGEGDPSRLADLDAKGGEAAVQARDDAARAVHAGRGPEHIQPVAMQAAEELGTIEVASREASAPAPEGPEQFTALGLPAEVQASFDEQQGPAMEQSLSEAVTAADDAATQRDLAKKEAVDTARAGEERLREEAASGRAEAVKTARGSIGDARNRAEEDQDSALRRVQDEASERRRTDADAVDKEVGAGRTRIDADFAEADAKIAGEVSEGERRAEAEKKKAEREAQNQSWWDRAVDFVKSAISSLMSAIGDIFDAVRAAVNTVLDVVKKAALAVIAGVASFIKSAIAAFGSFLKAIVSGLIGKIFPALAARLNRAIDAAVDAAQKGVDAVADTLSRGVAALVEGLRAGLNKLVDVFQAAVEIAVGLAAAAITGDWSGLLRKALEAVLRVVGVDPQSFYGFVGRAQETLSIIVNDPLTFVGNLAAAVKGGIRAFADNIGTHLQQGVIGWLTGALGSAGITIPERFDLMGVLDLARQILGLTWENLKAKAVRLIGERNVERIEQAADWIQTLVVEGWGGLWNRIMGDLAALRDRVFDGIRSFIQERIIISAITKLASLLNPVGAIVQLVMAAWNIYTFVRDQLARLADLVRTVVGAIGDIARGALDGAVAAVEGVLGRLLPLAIDLLARLLGLGNIAGKAREILGRIRGAIDRAIDKLLAKVVGRLAGSRRGEPSETDVESTRQGAGDVHDQPVDASVNFRVAGEAHTFRSTIVGGRVVASMASAGFGPLVRRVSDLVKRIDKVYLSPKSEKFIGTARSNVVRQKTTEIRAKAASLVAELREAESSTGGAGSPRSRARRRRKIVVDGFSSLRQMIEGLELPEVTTEVIHPGHGPRSGGVDSHGRVRSFLVDPLSIDSLDKGGSASGEVPGVRILPGYDRGHLVARSLGGPGTADNLVPMSKAANTERVGMQGIEHSLRAALRFVARNPQQFPPDNPQYVFRYSVRVSSYGTPAELQQDLVGRRVAVDEPQAGAQLFALARKATSEPPSPNSLVAVVGPTDHLTARERSNLASNLRRRLAYFFNPRAIRPTVEVLREPTDNRTKQPIHTGGEVPGHLGVDVAWHG